MPDSQTPAQNPAQSPAAEDQLRSRTVPITPATDALVGEDAAAVESSLADSEEDAQEEGTGGLAEPNDGLREEESGLADETPKGAADYARLRGRMQALEALLHQGELRVRERAVFFLAPAAVELVGVMAKLLGVKRPELLEIIILNFYENCFGKEHLILTDIATFVDGLVQATQEHTNEVRDLQMLAQAVLEQEAKAVTRAEEI